MTAKFDAGRCRICRETILGTALADRSTCDNCDETRVKITGDSTWLSDLRWRAAIKLMRWTVAVMPDGSAKMLLHELHLDWCAECRRQWNARYGSEGGDQ